MADGGYVAGGGLVEEGGAGIGELCWLGSFVGGVIAAYDVGSWTWSTRSDVAAPNGLKPLAEYQTTDATAFPKFMRDRAAVERFRSQIELYVGRVVGSNPADPNNTPGRS